MGLGNHWGNFAGAGTASHVVSLGQSVLVFPWHHAFDMLRFTLAAVMHLLAHLSVIGRPFLVHSTTSGADKIWCSSPKGTILAQWPQC
jgi:hypothetical protein